MPNGSIFYMPVHNLLLCYFLALYSIHCLVIIWVRNWFLADSGLIAAQCGTVDTCVQICISLYRPIHCGPQWIKFWKWTWRKPRPPLHLYMPNMCVFIYIYMYCVCDITRRESYLMVIDPDHSSANSSPDDRRSASAVVNNPSHHLVYICYVTGLDGAIFLNRFETHRQNFILGCYLKARRPPTMGVRTRLRVLPFPKFVHHQDEYILQFYLVIFFLWAWKLIYSM